MFVCLFPKLSRKDNQLVGHTPRGTTNGRRRRCIGGRCRLLLDQDGLFGVTAYSASTHGLHANAVLDCVSDLFADIRGVCCAICRE